jgi:hypothetical protein
MRLIVLLCLASFACASQAQSTDCSPSGDVSFVCGVKNPEDLVLVPGTQWIVSSGMAEGAGFYLVDSRSGSASVLPFAADPDPSFAPCTTPPTPQTLNTHGLSIRSTGQGRARRSRCSTWTRPASGRR